MKKLKKERDDFITRCNIWIVKEAIKIINMSIITLNKRGFSELKFDFENDILNKSRKPFVFCFNYVDNYNDCFISKNEKIYRYSMNKCFILLKKYFSKQKIIIKKTNRPWILNVEWGDYET